MFFEMFLLNDLFQTQCFTGVVLCCGDLTALGRVAGLAARLKPALSPLARELKSFMRCMSLWALCLGFFLAIASLIIGYPFMQTIIFVIGIIVANIPEGKTIGNWKKIKMRDYINKSLIYLHI